MSRRSDRIAVGTYLNPETHKALKRLSVEEGIPLQEVIQNALASFLAGNPPGLETTTEKPLSRMTEAQRLEHGADVLAYIHTNGCLRVDLFDRKLDKVYGSVGRVSTDFIRIKNISIDTEGASSSTVPDLVLTVQLDADDIAKWDRDARRDEDRRKKAREGSKLDI